MTAFHENEVYMIVYEGPGDKWHGPQVFFYDSEEHALADVKNYAKDEGRLLYIQGGYPGQASGGIRAMTWSARKRNL